MGTHNYLQNFDPELFLSKGNTGTKMEQRLKGRPFSCWPILRCIPQAGNKPRQYYWCHAVLADRKKPCRKQGCFLKDCASSWLKQIQILTIFGLRSRTPLEELGKGLKERKRMVISQEGQQSQLTRTSGSSQCLSHQPKSIYVLLIYVYALAHM